MAKQTKYARVGGMTFQAETVAAAKASGEERIARLTHEANLGPSMYQVGDITALVWPLLDSWAYTLFGGPTNKTAPNGIVPASTVMGGTRETAILSAVSHASSWQWSHDVADDEAYYRAVFWGCLRSGVTHAATANALKECIHQAGWQRRWKAAFDVCGDKTWSHDVASRSRTVDEARELAKREAA